MSVLAQVRGEGAWLVDTGNREPAERLMKPFLRSRGVDHLAGIVLTHGDSLHVGGAARLAQDFPANEVLTPCLRQRSIVYRRVVAEMDRRGSAVRELKRGDRVGPWHVLHPAAEDRFTRADDSALVLLGELDRTRVLLLSDLGPEGQQALLQRGGNLEADIVVTGLPSRGEPLSNALLSAVRPKLIIVCDSEFPFNERADASLRLRFETRGVPVRYTQSSGVVTLTVCRGGWRLSSAAEEEAVTPTHIDAKPASL
jgi:competence protein ComEC